MHLRLRLRSLFVCRSRERASLERPRSLRTGAAGAVSTTRSSIWHRWAPGLPSDAASASLKDAFRKS